MIQLYFIRHGESQDNALNAWSHTDTPLTELGRAQAFAVAKSITEAKLRFDRIVASPLTRTLETAQIVASEIGYPPENITTNMLFVERNWGDLAGTAKVHGSLGSQERRLLDHDKSVESIDALQQRATEALAFLQSLSEEVVLLVGHAAFGRALWRVINNQPATLEYDVNAVQVFTNGNLVRFV